MLARIRVGGAHRGLGNRRSSRHLLQGKADQDEIGVFGPCDVSCSASSRTTRLLDRGAGVIAHTGGPARRWRR